MKTECNDCRYFINDVCTHTKAHNKLSCEYLTLVPDKVQYYLNKRVNEETKKDLYRQFFYTMRMYLSIHSRFNQYPNMMVYYSVDQGGFRKRHSNNAETVGNWIGIEFDINSFFYLRNQLGGYDVKKTIHIENGRKVGDVWVKDDLYKLFKQVVDTAFKRFYDKHKPIRQNPVQIGGTAQPLF